MLHSLGVTLGALYRTIMVGWMTIHHARSRRDTKEKEEKDGKKISNASFRSKVLRVMSPARFRCATVEILDFIVAESG